MQKDLVGGMEGRKCCREAEAGRLTAAVSILLPPGTVLGMALLERQGSGVALSQLMFLHRARGVRSLWAQLFSHLPFAA